MNSTRMPANITALLDRPIAFHRVFVDLSGSVTAALMLSQAVYWQNRCPVDDGREPGWWYKNREEWTRETGLTRREQESARRILKRIGVLHERRSGNPARLWYRVDGEKLAILLGENRPSSWHRTAHQNGQNQPNSHSTETTTEITSVSRMRSTFPEDQVLARNILADIRIINPSHKEPNLTKWANTIRLMRELDGRAREEILGLWQWANKHQFWSSNILSPEKLRNKWDQLVIQRKRAGETGEVGRATANKPPKPFPPQEASRGH